MLESRFNPRNGKVIAEEIFGIKSNLKLQIGIGLSFQGGNFTGAEKLGRIIADFTSDESQGKLDIQSGHPEVPTGKWSADYRPRQLVDQLSHHFADRVHVAGTNDEYVIGPQQAIVSPGFYGCQVVLAIAGDVAYFKHNRDTRLIDGIEFLDRVLVEHGELDSVTFLSDSKDKAHEQKVLASRNRSFGIVNIGIVPFRPFRFWALNNQTGNESGLLWAVTPENEGRQVVTKVLPVNLITG